MPQWIESKHFSERVSNEPFSRVVFILFLDLLTRQMLGNLFLMGTRVTCLIWQGLKLWSRHIRWDLLTVVSMSFSNKLMLNDWIWRTHITDMFESRWEQVRLQEELSLKEKALRETQIRNKHVMGEMKRTHSRTTNRQILCTSIERKSWDSTKAHFTNAVYAKERMNSKNDSGEFQEVRIEITVVDCLTFPVNLRWFWVLALCWAAKKRLPLDTWTMCQDKRFW